jgi:hypothetical protein
VAALQGDSSLKVVIASRQAAMAAAVAGIATRLAALESGSSLRSFVAISSSNNMSLGAAKRHLSLKAISRLAKQPWQQRQNIATPKQRWLSSGATTRLT